MDLSPNPLININETTGGRAKIHTDVTNNNAAINPIYTLLDDDTAIDINNILGYGQLFNIN